MTVMLAVTFTEWTLGVGFFVSTFALVFTLYRWLQERAERRAEQSSAAKLRDELNEIQRRGRAPFLQATFLHVPPIPPRGNQILSPGQEVVMDQVDSGTILQLDLSNDGEEVRDIDDDWTPPEGFQILPNGIPRDHLRAAFINYKYDRSKHGSSMRIKLFFETRDGLKLFQVYETRHGVCCFKRIDPS